ncbi:MAG: protein kinase [Polyangiaceae bacterium]|nr:protein kinase [Polyangiaceae bacterium]
MASSAPIMRPCPQCETSCSTEHHYCPACGFPVGTVGRATEDKLIGRSLPGGYHVLDLISVGGMGRVYRAEQSVLGRTVAVKVIHPHLLADENSAVRFMTEARAASQLNHPNSISVFDFGRTDDGQPYLVMEFLRGQDLARVAWEEGPLPFTRIVDVLRQVLAALGEAHDLGIVHRDLKPENVIIEPLRRGGDFVKVVDFGLAKLKQDEQATNVTSPGIVCGTPDYMAPEQGRGDPIDGRSDLYAVGVMLFQLLTSRLPFEADNPTQVVMMHLSIPVPDPRQVAPERNIPDSIAEVCLKALQKDAAARYQDALEFADALKHALELAVSLPPERSSSLPPMSLVPGATTVCGSCSMVVPQARFCCECGARLPAVTQAPDASQFPLPFLGRDDDLAWLEDRRQQVGGTTAAGARIVGELGSGKSRLLQEFANRAVTDGDVFVWVQPDPYWSEAAYHSVRQAIFALLGVADGKEAALRFASASADAKQGLDDVSSGGKKNGERSPTERRYSVAEALRHAIRRASEDHAAHRIILAIDELHRVDPPSRFAFADAIGEPPEVPLLMVCSHVPGFESGWGASHAARMLAGLPPPALSRLLRRVPGAPVVDDEDSGRGVLPLYVEQLTRFAIDGGNDAPARLGDLVALRLDMLEPEPRRVLQALAVLGDKTRPGIIGELLPANTDVPSALDALEAAGMVRLEGDGVSTSHPLLRELVLAGLPAAVRRELHAKALRVCDDVGAPLEAKAHHAYEAQDSFQALLLLEQVADRAASRGDVLTEVESLRRGLEIARREIARGELDDPMRAVLIFARKLGTALTRAGNFADAEGVLREALDYAGPSGTDRAKVLGGLADIAHGRHREREALGYIEQAIETARESGAHDLVDTLTDTRRAWAS